jgi:radical SAM family RiPP maturation amino acid epimerase
MSEQSTTLTAEEITEAARIKRFVERLQGDSEFRQSLPSAPEETIARYNLQVSADEVRPAWDKEYVQRHAPNIPLSPALVSYQKLCQQMDEWAETWDVAGRSKCIEYRTWRERQIARCSSELGPSYNKSIPHAAMTFELSKGCSVGCWFCAISAPRLSDHFYYTRDNARLWQDVLDVLSDIYGPAAAAGFCYWATDPMDNPDYEHFCRDFHATTGNFPQTTTALPLKDPARMRRLLKESCEKGCRVNRFSLLTRKMLDRVHAEYTAEELTYTRFVFQMPDGALSKSRSGRAAERLATQTDRYRDYLFMDGGTIACVSGLLFNMVERSVRLISPCNTSERWPLGYRVYDEGSFCTGDELHEILVRWIHDHMPVAVQPDEIVRFRRDLRYEEIDEGFRLSTRYHARKYTSDPYVKHIGRLIQMGNKTAEVIASSCLWFGVTRSEVFDFLNMMFRNGVLDEEPAPKPCEATFGARQSSLETVSLAVVVGS